MTEEQIAPAPALANSKVPAPGPGSRAPGAPAVVAPDSPDILGVVEAELAGLDDSPLSVQVETYSRVHAALQRELTAIDRA